MDAGVLIEQAVGGDASAMERLLLDRANWLSRLIARQLPETLRGAVDVDDVLQQTFIRAFRGIGSLAARSEPAFQLWLATIAQNQLRDTLKALRRRKRAADRRAQDGPVTDSHGALVQLVERLSDRGDTPQHGAARREAIRAIQVGVARLAEDQRWAIQLYLIEGKSLLETAATMARTPDAVRGLIHRGKQHLRALLANSSRWLDKKN
jgi:RNA polymerase sigma-70 factor (ECF subfamily)